MRRGVAIWIAIGLAACASSEDNNGNIDAAETDAPELDAPDDAPTDAAIDAVDACVPVDETCNDADDDCDLMVDEGLGLGVACDGADGDLCDEGMVICAVSGGTTCSDLTTDSTETCNAADDDCDLATDEGFDLGMPCDGADTDACVEGVVVCNGIGGTTCDDVTAGTAEVCNMVDDDCRNGVDDGYAVGGACSAGVGGCNRPGSTQCNAQGTGVECDAVAGSPTPEFCGDGLDQDCNGSDLSCPTNDLATGAINITNGGTFTVDLTAANDNNPNTACGSTGGRDVFYTFTLPAPEVVYVDTIGSNYDTVVRIFNGSCTALGVNAACFDDACSTLQTQGAVQLAGGTYCLVVDQYSSNQTLGSTTLTFTRGGRTGTVLPSTSGTVTGTTVGGTNVSSPSCGSSSPVAPDDGHFFLVCPAITRTVTAGTCTTPASWDSILHLRRAPASSADLICNDDGLSPCGTASPIRLSSFTGGTAAGPGLFWVIVDGYNGVSGAYTLSYTIQ